MSFAKQLIGRECGESNSVLKITHHLTSDIGHRQERLPQTFEDDLYKAFPPPITSDQLIHEFTNISPFQPVQPFRMDALLREMNEIDSRSALGPPVMVHPGVTQMSIGNLNQFPGLMTHNHLADIWAKDMTGETNMNNELGSIWADSQINDGANLVNVPIILNDTNNLQGNLSPNAIESEAESWQEEYNKLEIIKDASETLGAMAGVGSIEETIFDNEQKRNWKTAEWNREYDHALKTGNFDNITVDTETMSQKENEEFWNNLQDEWNTISSEIGDKKHPWLNEFEYDNQFDHTFEEYKFQKENEYREHTDPLEEGKRYLEQGDIPTAILLFEAAAQEMPDNHEAWLLLGTTHAQNEQDILAISALRKCVLIDQTNLAGWMALATSYTNEAYQNYACHALKQWLTSNDEYKNLVKENSHRNADGSFASRSIIEETKDLYFRAANVRNAANIDYDVQCGIGTLLYITGDYDKAIDCFHLALQVKPEDAKLWNKLGASMANGNRSEEAVNAYRNALELFPGFIRCRYNLGIACLNLGSYRDAMGHFLEALTMQENVKIKSSKSNLVVSDSIWTTLRLTVLRKEYGSNIISAVQNRDLATLNKEFCTNKFN